MSPVGLSVVICAHSRERWDDLRSAVASVRAQGPAVDEVLVVIDHNEDLLQRSRESLEGATVLASEGPPGLSGARNTGWKSARGEVVAFLDDDAVAEDGWVEELLAPYDDPDVLGVGGWATPAWDTGAPRWFPEEFLWVVGCSYRGLPRGSSTIRNMIGCNMSVRRDVLVAVGGFDTGLGRTSDRPLGCEETELCIRAVEVLGRGRFVSRDASVVHHRVREARTRWSYFRRRCHSEGVSKAWVARRVGSDSALSSERSYTSRVLPSGVLRGLIDTLRGDPWGVVRSSAIIAGLLVTAVSYFAEMRRRGPRTPSAPLPEPVIEPVIIDVSEPLASIAGRQATPGVARALVVDRGQPLGLVEIEMRSTGLEPDDIAQELRAQLGVDVGPIRDRTSAEQEGERTVDRSSTVVVATRDRTDSLEKCLRSILDGVSLPEEIILVDSAPSDDGTRELVARMSELEPSIRYVRQTHPGLGLAHNTALPLVRTPKVLFTDDDVVVHPWWLRRMSAAFGAGSDVVCVTGMIAPLELETAAQRWIEDNAGFGKGLDRVLFDLEQHRHDDALYPFAAGVFGSGANMGFSTEYLRARGGFDPALGAGTPAMGGDDLAAFYDAVSSGRELCYEPAAIVSHRHHRLESDLRRQAYGYGAGLTSHLTRCVLEDPRVLPAMLRGLGGGIGRASEIALAPTATETPRRLWVQHLRGMLAGPFRYLRSRGSVRRTVATAASPPGAAR